MKGYATNQIVLSLLRTQVGSLKDKNIYITSVILRNLYNTHAQIHVSIYKA